MEKPLYRKVISDLENKIDSMRANDQLPSERQLLTDYDVSRNTIRLALKDLEDRGVIYRLHGKGTFVAGRYLNKLNIGGMYSFSEDTSRYGRTATTQNKKLELVVPNHNISDQLNLQEEDKTYRLIRLRLADDEPMIYSKTYLPEKLFPDLKITDLENDTLYSVLKKKYNQRSVMAFEDVQAVSLDDEASASLHEKVGSPSLKIYRKTINDKNVPVEFTISLARGDKFVYRSRQYNHLV
ncbi:GntR family transcriptional regulator [Lactobacillus sp. ESL0791]|uniref:GntR family transcriptional regulator n=1 Tax=Lactobacillus sp. ESL0791 TaxID=2983234 RepID=UPI0023F732F7|nr:GntR family transcriptional regulator [Lactobacillus sp. ESL0791]MDF7639370.1 GntR family transcriptional regulator [Lactobacillus sp. ESL0791]